MKIDMARTAPFLSFFLSKISEASTVLGSPTLELQRSPVAVQIYIHTYACMCLFISLHLFLQELFTVTLHGFTFLRSQSLQPISTTIDIRRKTKES